ncbi:hypothetical protein BaRGS_00030515 [Batillaria attramentaria]|uniref:Uncharacterized protein n=1 Tax=Batillaria attramentaria TaxID=370345 RepID=A0ABD0JTG7_9CAEN
MTTLLLTVKAPDGAEEKRVKSAATTLVGCEACVDWETRSSRLQPVHATYDGSATTQRGSSGTSFSVDRTIECENPRNVRLLFDQQFVCLCAPFVLTALMSRGEPAKRRTTCCLWRRGQHYNSDQIEVRETEVWWNSKYYKREQSE